ncbi:2OG-Fe(II) oxygenase [Microbacterium deminutum]|uniref:Fe2OG dioxygenase domain-containing protein n=1 Tax=Microbacterium deminutum TaxID=344164 RepID=A0ABN2QXM6_9MICO
MSLAAHLTRTGIAWADDWLDERDARRIREELDFTFWKRSQVLDRGPEGLHSRESTERTSESTNERWFTPKLRERVARIEQRICLELDVEAERLEPWQAVRYEPGGRFGIHHDGGSFADDPAGERVLTFLLCLQAPDAGGATYFPELDLVVPPVVGRLIVWQNLTPSGEIDERMRHAATPVHQGRKVMLTTWSRQHAVPRPVTAEQVPADEPRTG